jgi:lipopolysaccharide/colanic/teichoic acid biosynthesis glycosyltransferase
VIHPFVVRGRPVAERVPPPLSYVASKRALDLFVVGALAPLWLPLYALISVAILVFDGPPVHYRDHRVGRGGRDLVILKFRSMHLNAKDDLAALLAAEPALEMEFFRFAKLHTDPRLTRIGRFLRRLSLDELPQLLRVLHGDMSLVGPRPITRREINRFYGNAAGEVLSVLPGLTGLWQISGRSLLSCDERALLDLQYVRDRSFGRDLTILFKTIPKVLSGHGAA